MNSKVKTYAQIIVDVEHARLDRIFEYAIPESLAGEDLTGYRVLVPFGQSNRKIEGFVLSVSLVASYDVDKIKEIVSIKDDFPLLYEDQIQLAKWMSEKYNAFLVECLRVMMPAEIRRDRIKTKTIKIARLNLDIENYERAVASLISSKGKIKAPKQMQILELLNQTELEISGLNQIVGSCSAALKAMESRDWIQISEVNSRRKPDILNIDKQDISLKKKLCDEQESAYNILVKALENKNGVFCLKGVTGSGKTEVYMQAIDKCIEMGRTAIVLVPEISLTPQTVERFAGRFHGEVAVMHSRLSAGERYDEWMRIRSGAVKVVVGARSAVFSPLKNMGLIVIDEEHEDSYNSDRTPRYSSYEVARKRCLDHGAVLILGTATPSIETWTKVKSGEISALSMNKRINDRPMPEIKIVDMREELTAGNRSMFSSDLYMAMKDCYISGKQMILFLNRRGYSTFVNCRSCGEVIKCDSCDVSMTYHKNSNVLRCHYCDSSKKMPEICPFCGEKTIKQFGAGTQQVEEMVAKSFPGIRITRMDYDTTRGKDGHAKLLEEFKSENSDVLIGTQMIAKGLDFPSVTLVGVIAADASLHVPDYRSAEKTFQLLTQVAGRAGRDKDPGNVIIQTYSPEHPSIIYSSRYDFDSFYDYEIKCRKTNEFPPYSDFVRFLFVGDDPVMLDNIGKIFAEKLQQYVETAMDELGIPKENMLYISSHKSPLHFIRSKYRHQVVVKLTRCEKSEQLIHAIAVFTKKLGNELDVLPNMEINPSNMS